VRKKFPVKTWHKGLRDKSRSLKVTEGDLEHGKTQTVNTARPKVEGIELQGNGRSIGAQDVITGFKSCKREGKNMVKKNPLGGGGEKVLILPLSSKKGKRNRWGGEPK